MITKTFALRQSSGFKKPTVRGFLLKRIHAQSFKKCYTLDNLYVNEDIIAIESDV